MSAGSATDPLAHLREQVLAACSQVIGHSPPDTVRVERPKQAAHGHYATNAALVCAPAAKANPREFAERLVEELRDGLGDSLLDATVAGPGFVNLTLADSWFVSAVGHLLEAGEGFGRNIVAQPERILVEYVSANPTGPMHIGHGRNAAYGDSLCRVLEQAGHEVAAEFYINDFGSQIDRFGASIVARARGKDPTEDGYQGEYISDLASHIPDAAETDSHTVALLGVGLMISQIRATLERLSVRIDNWFSERSLQADGSLAAALDALESAGHTYVSDGALWLRTTTFGDDKDRVLRRSSGELTYFATDIAYHLDKRGRGFERLIDVWGADHHGYVARMKAAYAANGEDPDALEPVIMQLVNLTERGDRVAMSKRSGEFVTVDQLIDDIGVDAVRFFLLQRSHDTAMDLDLALARERSQDNPVYYVQYAHARICSILDKVGSAARPESGAPAQGFSLQPSERALLQRILEFPAEVEEAALRRSPHRFTVYSRDLAAEFSAFYRDCPVAKAEPMALADFRVQLCSITRDLLARSLGLLGVSAPQRM